MSQQGGDAQKARWSRTLHQLRSQSVPIDTPNPLRSGIHTRGYLPHVKCEGASYFVTFRLGDAVPKQVLAKLQQENAARLRQIETMPKQVQRERALKSARELQKQIAICLDQGHGACHLRCPDIARLVRNTLRHFDGERYVLDEWVIMPNHVHVIVWPMPNHLLGGITKSWKQSISRRAKRILNLGTAPFWQTESFDHWIRDEAEKARIRAYVRNNPVAAGLCKRPEDWPWSSAAEDAGAG